MKQPAYRCQLIQVILILLTIFNVCDGRHRKFESMLLNGLIDTVATSIPWSRNLQSRQQDPKNDDDLRLIESKWNVTSALWTPSMLSSQWAASLLSGETAWDYVESVRPPHSEAREFCESTRNSVSSTITPTFTLRPRPTDHVSPSCFLDEVLASVVKLSGVVVTFRCLVSLIKSNNHSINEVCTLTCPDCILYVLASWATSSGITYPHSFFCAFINE